MVDYVIILYFKYMYVMLIFKGFIWIIFFMELNLRIIV